jgi:glycosidase
MMEFHISREARVRYQVSDVLFNYVGNVVFGDLAASRQLANRINEARNTASDPEKAVNPGALFAMGLIDEISHATVAYYRKNHDPEVMVRALAWFEERIGRSGVDKMLRSFVDEFPNVSVFRGEVPADEWLRGSTGGVTHREVVLEELMLLWLANQNPAFGVFKELFDDSRISETTAYPQVTSGLGEYFATRPLIQTSVTGDKSLTLLELLRAPVLAAPNSLSDQLAFLRQHWGNILGENFRRLLLAVDVLKEEDVAIWMRFHPPSEAQRRLQRQYDPQDVHSEVTTFSRTDEEYEAFSADVEWMPTAVLLAKSTYVWLAQLSRQYGRPIQRLDQIPDEELDLIASRGLNSLWLIGIWERSLASKTIKRLCGQDDAVASAYSLANYAISADLGGESAYRNLRDRAHIRGIRLASDMVPNHMGIDSNWMIDHPEYFLSRSDSPYPAYQFEGPDLSWDSRVEIKIEDHYYEQTDAAVVFRRRDKYTGHVDYIYHGNDGTSFPWNDTAQLNYLNAPVREQVIQTILYVARLFPIIRFDAAMTLARRHVQRLWFPLPGHGGAIPSRAEYSMTQEEFDRAMPNEFWREVVDRVAAEVPGTLLLAEAFWLMEGYFVRTLGMHRVYNSAFMNMMRDEENAKYRSVLKNTLEFDPDIMKRYVNFMSNPDERTAIDQFGTGDKYFGVCSLLATLPGLPMLGHGQVEGFTEKYGMEYQRPRYEEDPNPDLVARHMREIAPLLKNRKLFAESAHFLLYDFWTEYGTVDENVFAYSNRNGDQRALVIFHNRYGQTKGTIHHSASYADKGSGSLTRRSLQEGLALPNDQFLAYRDSAKGLEHLRRASDVAQSGLSFELHAYQYGVLLDWRELRVDQEHPWDKLFDSLHGAGVPSLDEALIRLKLKPLTDALKKVLDRVLLRALEDLAEVSDAITEHDVRLQKSSLLQQERDAFFRAFSVRAKAFLKEAHATCLTGLPSGSRQARVEEERLERVLDQFVLASLRIPRLERFFSTGWSAQARAVLPSHNPSVDSTAIWAPVLGWCLVRVLADCVQFADPQASATDVFDQLRLRAAYAEIFATLGLEGEDSWRAAARIRLALASQAVPAKASGPVAADAVEAAQSERRATQPVEGSTATEGEAKTISSADRWLWDDPDVKWLTGLHKSEGILYFVQETYEQLLWWTKLPELIELAEQPKPDLSRIGAIETYVQERVAAAKKAGYKLDELLRPQGAPSTDAVQELAADIAAGTTPEPVSYHAVGPDSPPASAEESERDRELREGYSREVGNRSVEEEAKQEETDPSVRTSR